MPKSLAGLAALLVLATGALASADPIVVDRERASLRVAEAARDAESRARGLAEAWAARLAAEREHPRVDDPAAREILERTAADLRRTSGTSSEAVRHVLRQARMLESPLHTEETVASRGSARRALDRAIAHLREVSRIVEEVSRAAGVDPSSPSPRRPGRPALHPPLAEHQAAELRSLIAALETQAQGFGPPTAPDDRGPGPSPSIGSGVFVAPGVVLTTSCLVRGATSAIVETAGTSHAAVVLHRSEALGVALLEVQDVKGTPIPWLLFRPSDDAPRLLACGWVGQGAQARLAVREARTAATCHTSEQLVLGIPVHPDEWGGVLVDPEGLFVGLLAPRSRWSQVEEAQGKAFAVSGHAVKLWLEEQGLRGSGLARPTLLEDQLRAAVVRIRRP